MGTENFTQRQKEWDNSVNVITEQELASLRAQAKRLFGNEKVWFKMPRCIAWDKVDNSSAHGTSQVLPSFKVYTPPVTYPEEGEETIGILMEVEPFDQTKIENLGLNTCSHDLFLSSREFPRVDEPEPKPLPNFSSVDVNLGDKTRTTHRTI
uniref:Ribonuclease H-like domain-containing protein n=1 Tax=Tanacetum cinerariifolium TaxID=118510 RepID=A0A6L2NWE0_TANCI|nr:ribonuclease H-like domain-containing protein [Tanacetum cinerariifolium]